jgi:hypothetical protein
MSGVAPVGAIAFALRGRLGTAALLTVDETRTLFAPWKASSASAVASIIRHSEEVATTLALAPSALLQAPSDQRSKNRRRLSCWRAPLKPDQRRSLRTSRDLDPKTNPPDEMRLTG